jgi:hypothetical protein
MGRVASAPLLTAVPVIDILANLIFRQTLWLLNLSFELFSTTFMIYDVRIVVSERSPLLFEEIFNLPPISFYSIAVHVNLREQPTTWPVVNT